MKSELTYHTIDIHFFSVYILVYSSPRRDERFRHPKEKLSIH